ncbi:motility-associated protein [Halothiobacillus sp.]
MGFAVWLGHRWVSYIAGGHIVVLFQLVEYLIIIGAALAALVGGNSGKT